MNGGRKERSDAMRVSPEEKADLDSRDVSRPFQRKVCRNCGKKFRTCSGGRLDCVQCSPPTLGRRLDPVVKEALREPKAKTSDATGDIRSPLAPPAEVLAAIEDLREERLRPQTTSEAIALLGRIGAHVAAGRISNLRGRTLTAIVSAQIKILQRQEHVAHQKTVALEREHRRNMRLAKMEADRKRRADEKEAKRLKAAEEKKINGGKPVVEVPLPQPSAQDLRIAEGQ